MATGERIRVARISRGMTQEELAEEVEITVEELQSYEAEEEEPAPETIWDIAETIGTELSFFLRTLPLVGMSPITESINRLDEDGVQQVVAQSMLWLERYLDIEAFLPIEEIPVGEYPSGFPMDATSRQQASDAAAGMRAAWRLGATTSVPDLTGELSRFGIKVGFVSGAENFDAAAFLSEGDVPLPVIIVQSGIPGDVQRFAMARELAYFMINDANVQIASHFAASFLMPEDAIKSELGNSREEIELYELYLLKAKYGISIRHLLTRAASLKIISREIYEGWIQVFQEMGWQTTEPGGVYPSEGATRMIQMALRLQAEGEVTPERAAEMLDLPFPLWDVLVRIGRQPGVTQTELVEEILNAVIDDPGEIDEEETNPV